MAPEDVLRSASCMTRLMTCTTCHDIYSTTGKALCSPTPQASCCSCFPSPVKWSRYRSRGMPSTCSNQQSSADIARKFRPGDDKHSHHYFSIFDKIWLFGPPTNSNTTQATLEKDNPKQTATQVCANRTWQNMRVLINITILFLLYIYIYIIQERSGFGASCTYSSRKTLSNFIGA